MDAINFVKVLRRMKKEDTWKMYELLLLNGTDSPEDAVNSIETWTKEHPVKTRQSEFLKQHPNVKIQNGTGIIHIRPCIIDQTVRTEYPCSKQCEDCYRQYWLEEI